MSSTIPFHSNAVDTLPDGIIPVAGSRKRKQAFSMTDPDNVELARLATQAAKKKTKLSMVNASGKQSTHQKKSAGPKSNHQLSNSKNVDKSEVGDSDDDDEAGATKKKGLSKLTPSQNKKNIKKKVSTNRQPSVEDVDDFTDSNHENVANAINDSESDDDDDMEIVEQPAESAEEELSS